MLVKLVRVCTGRTAIDSRNSAYLSSRDHIVVGGCGRSGTTLVRVLLDSHPRICCGPESKVFLPDTLRLRHLQKLFQFDPQALKRAYRASQSRTEFIDRMSELCCSMTGKPRWAEKTPRNVHNMDYLFTKFPRAKFVHVLRDGRDVACSLRMHPKHKVKNGKPVQTMEQCATRWRDSLTDAKRYWTDPRFHTIRYDELVANPRETIETLLKFLGEPWDDALLAHYQIKSTFREVTTPKHRPEENRPIDSISVARWKREMTDDDKRTFKSIAGDLLIELGYAKDHNW